jgi:hypothetical protein
MIILFCIYCRYISIEELIIDEGVFADVSLDKKADCKGKDLLEDEGQEKCEVNILGREVEYVDKVDEIEQKNELVTENHDVCELKG